MPTENYIAKFRALKGIENPASRSYIPTLNTIAEKELNIALAMYITNDWPSNLIKQIKKTKKAVRRQVIQGPGIKLRLTAIFAIVSLHDWEEEFAEVEFAYKREFAEKAEEAAERRYNGTIMIAGQSAKFVTIEA